MMTIAKKKLWIGGTSGLARTYLNAFSLDDFIVVGHEPSRPSAWMAPSTVEYYSCDLASVTKPIKNTELIKNLENVEQIVISIRPPLVSSMTNEEMTCYCKQLLHGLGIFLQELLLQNNNKIKSILHISSVAAANHLAAQQHVGLHGSENGSLVASKDLYAPYDVFKRACEEVLDSIPIPTIHLRLSAIFSDDPGCIQCNALGIQSRIGSYLPQCIDCNSSRNVASAIRLVLASQQQQQQQQQDKEQKLSRYYYYTRPVSQYSQPVPYGEYLVQYRQAHDLWFYIWLPSFIVCWFVEAVHWLSFRLSSWQLPFLSSVDYLLQVSYRHHSFDNSDFVRDFPEIMNQEETIQECFRRRQKVLQ